MANGRITASMDMDEILITMSEGIPGALMCMKEMLQADHLAYLDIQYFDSLGIYGSKINTLWNYCCGRDISKLNETIQYFRSGSVSTEEIHENLNRVRAVPFI